MLGSCRILILSLMQVDISCFKVCLFLSFFELFFRFPGVFVKFKKFAKLSVFFLVTLSRLFENSVSVFQVTKANSFESFHEL